jgi:uncharacterized membrane protein
MPLSAIAFLLLSATIMLIRSHYHLLWADEFGVFYTVSISSLARLIHLQLTRPVVFDPLVYSISAHASIGLFGESAFAIRLPSMCGYLLMQACLFYFVRRIASEDAATFALAFPALMGVSSYAVQARPYGLLLGLSALAMLSWQTATRRDSRTNTSACHSFTIIKWQSTRNTMVFCYLFRFVLRNPFAFSSAGAWMFLFFSRSVQGWPEFSSYCPSRGRFHRYASTT